MGRQVRASLRVTLLLLLGACAGSQDDSETEHDASAIDREPALDAAGVGDASGAPSPHDAGAGTAEAGVDAGLSARDAGADASRPLDAQVEDAARETGDAARLDAGNADGGRADAAVGDAGEAAFERAFHIALRVHRGDSALTGAAIARILEEVNEIWWQQAAICFEVEVVSDAQPRSDGFDFWFHRSTLGCGVSDSNGVYCGDHDIHSLDAPSLSPVDNTVWDTRQNPARTTAHELGHGLRLEHYNGFADSNDSLMSSGRQGFKLHESEITTARARAQMKALSNSSGQPCPAVPVAN